MSLTILTPALGFGSQLGQPIEIAALEEMFPDVLHARFHLGFVPGMRDQCWVGDEIAMLGIFQKAPGQPGMQWVRSCHRGGEGVDDQVFVDAPKNAQAASRPAMTSCSFWLLVGQTKQCREWQRLSPLWLRRPCRGGMCIWRTPGRGQLAVAARKEVLHAAPTPRFRQWFPVKNRGLSPLWDNGTLMVDDFHPAGG